MTELRQDEAYSRFMAGIGWKVEVSANGTVAYIRGLGLPLSVMKLQRAKFKDIDFDWVKKIAKKHRVIVIYVELLNQLKIKVNETIDLRVIQRAFEEFDIKMKKNGFRSIKNGMLATKTQTLNTTLDKLKLKQDFKSKHRYNLHLAIKNGLTSEVISGDQLIKDRVQLGIFLGMIRDNAKRVGYWAVPSKWLMIKLKAFGNKAFVVLIKKQARTIAVALFLTTKANCYYSFNGSNQEGRSLFAPTLAIWEAILEAKKRGLKELDFDGVSDERLPNKRWFGYSRFKRGFGGDYVYYPKAYIKWLPALTK